MEIVGQSMLLNSEWLFHLYISEMKHSKIYSNHIVSLFDERTSWFLKKDWIKVGDNQTQEMGTCKTEIQIIKEHKHKGIQLSITFTK